MEQVLPNGLRYYPRDTQTSFSEATLVIPVGENNEDRTSRECAHACEHFVCAFNGGFKNDYGFLDLRTKYGIQFNIHTYEDFTLYRLLSIPVKAIPEVCDFFMGIFNVRRPRSEIANRELAIIGSELSSGDPIDLIYYSYLNWIRHNNGTPSEEYADSLRGINPDNVFAFYSRYYKPSTGLFLVKRPLNQSQLWDRQISQKMAHSESFIFPGRVSERMLNDCIRCKMIEGSWIIPSKTCWGIIGVFFKGEPSHSEVLARGLIASSTRLSGEINKDKMSLTDYLRKEKGIAYSTTGKFVRIRDTYTSGTLGVIVFSMNRHLTRSEMTECMRIVSNKSRTIPSRGDLSSMVAKNVRSSYPEDVVFLLRRARIPILDGLDWSMVYNAYKTQKTDGNVIGGVFSCPI